MKIFRDDQGSALIEMAFVLPVFTALLVGVCSLGTVIQANMGLADSARAGAEYALTPGNELNTGQMQVVATTAAGAMSGYSAVATNFCTCSPGSLIVSCTSYCPLYGKPALYAQVVSSASIPLLFTASSSIAVKSVARVRIACPTC